MRRLRKPKSDPSNHDRGEGGCKSEEKKLNKWKMPIFGYGKSNGRLKKRGEKASKKRGEKTRTRHRTAQTTLKWRGKMLRGKGRGRYGEKKK